LNKVFHENAAASLTAAVLWGWRDLAAHWTRPQPPGAPLWPLWLTLGVLAFALLDSISLAFDVSEAHAAATFDPRLKDFFEIVTRAGQSGWLFALSILTLVYALYRREGEISRRARAGWGLLASRALYFFAVQAISGILAQLVKHVVGRARPKLIDTLGPQHFDVFSLKAVLASFPSGHTTTIVAAAASLSFFMPPKTFPWTAALFFALVLPVAASRLIVGAHYPSDVLGGAFLGLASALAVARAFGRRKIAFTLEEGRLLPKARRLNDQA
jgi:membrane-associated phospholipid phosphatase